MKNLKLLVLVMGLFLSSSIKAQVSVNVNIGSPPQWGPVGYAETRYYYLPDVEAYYDVHTSMFIYFGDGVWIHRGSLPARYHGYDLYSGYKVVMIDYHGDAPYHDFKDYKRKYAKGYRGGPQKTIGSNPGKGNSNKKMSPKGSFNKQGNHGNEKNIRNSNDNGNSQGHNKNGKADHGHGGGNGKKK
ncbi:MAG: hypothetical protein V4511_14950 [Bacteroidota bacterium]